MTAMGPGWLGRPSHQARQVEARLLRFLATGCLNTAFGYSVYALGLLAGLHFTIAAAASTLLGVAFNFATSARLVFKSLDHRRFPRFLLVYAITYTGGISVTALLQVVGVTPYVSGLILIVPSALVAYRLQSKFVFGDV